jgi:hypothetical protein
MNSILGNTSSMSNVIAVGEVHCLVLAHDTFEKFLREDEGFSRAMSALVEDRKKRINARASIQKQHTNIVSDLRPPSVKETRKLSFLSSKKGEKHVNNYIMMKDLGNGSFGKVKLVRDIESMKEYAMKIIDTAMLLKRGKLQNNGIAMADILNEIEIMKKLNHPNIVTLCEIINDQQSNLLCLVQVSILLSCIYLLFMQAYVHVGICSQRPCDE